jgi:hypothetical protein
MGRPQGTRAENGGERNTAAFDAAAIALRLGLQIPMINQFFRIKPLHVNPFFNE